MTPDRDAKLGALRTLIIEKTGTGQINSGNRKVLVFSAFADTVTYLYDQLASDLQRSHGLTCAQVTGTRNRITGKRYVRGSFEDILGRFSPHSKECIAFAEREGRSILFSQRIASRRARTYRIAIASSITTCTGTRFASCNASAGSTAWVHRTSTFRW